MSGGAIAVRSCGNNLTGCIWQPDSGLKLSADCGQRSAVELLPWAAPAGWTVPMHTMCGWRGDCRPRVAGVLHAWLAVLAASTRAKRRVLGRVLGRQTGDIGAGVHSYQPTSDRAQFVQHAHTPPRSTPHDLFPPCSKHLLWPLHQQHQRQRQQLRAQPRRCGLGFQAWLVTPLPLRLV